MLNNVMGGMQQPLEPQQGQMPQAGGAAMPEYDQALVDEISTNASHLLYSKGTREQIISALESNDDAEGVANVAVMLIGKLEGSSPEPLPDTELALASLQLIEEIIEFGEEARVISMDEPKKDKAIALAFEMYMKAKVNEGKYDPEELMAIVDGMDLQYADDQDSLPQEPMQEQPPQQQGGLLDV